MNCVFKKTRLLTLVVVKNCCAIVFSKDKMLRKYSFIYPTISLNNKMGRKNIIKRGKKKKKKKKGCLHNK